VHSKKLHKKTPVTIRRCACEGTSETSMAIIPTPRTKKDAPAKRGSGAEKNQIMILQTEGKKNKKGRQRPYRETSLLDKKNNDTPPERKSIKGKSMSILWSP
jgi:hypothetical protein